jgi:hypothetical protein
MSPATAIENECRDFIPQAHWGPVTSALARSIELAHESNPDSWGIRFDGVSIMLKVGPHEILQIGPWPLPVHIVVDRATIPPMVRAIPGLEFSGDHDWHGRAGRAGYYVSNPGTEACNLGFAHLPQVFSDLFESHAISTRRAAKKQRHGSTRATHCPELVMLVGREAGRRLAQPGYWVQRY